VHSGRMDPFGRSLLLTRVSDQLSDHDRAAVSSAMRFRTPWRISSRCVGRGRGLIRPGRPNPVLVAFPMELEHMLPQPIVITTSKAFTALKILGCSCQCRCPLGQGLDGDGDDPYPLPALLSAYRTDCHNQATTVHKE
jgi:hypothetical protein